MYYDDSAKISQDMKQKKHRVRNIAKPSWFGDSIHYWPPDALALAHAMALIETVATNSEQAGDIYQQLFDAWKKPGIKTVYDEIISEVPDSDKEEWKQKLRFPELALENGVNKPWTDFNNLVNEPDFENIFSTSEKQIEPISPEEQEHLDEVANLFTLILEFIIVGFNREADIAKGKYRVLPSINPPWLILAIMYRTAFDSHKITLDRLRKIYKVRKIKGKVYDFEEVLTKQPNSRMHRWMVSGGKQAGLVLRHDDKFMESAWRWYQCRVVCSSIEDFCNKQAEEVLLDTKNIHKEIRPFDEAVGYGKHSKSK